MTSLVINNSTFDIDPNEFFNLKSLIPKVQLDYPYPNFILEQITMNGESITYNSEHPYLVRPLQNTDQISLQFSESNGMMKDIILETCELTDSIMNKISRTIKLFQDQEALDLNQHDLSKIVDGVSLFIQSINYIVQNIPNSEDIKKDLPIKELQTHLLSILKAAKAAQQKGDYFMLADLLEYELKDNLTQWKILIMPTVRNQIKERLMSI